VLTINDDSNITKMHAVFEKVDSSLPVLLDKGSNVVSAYQAYSIPLYYLVNQEQRISRVWIGSVKERESELAESIAGLLDSPASSEEAPAALD
jgi:hypothetical protein